MRRWRVGLLGTALLSGCALFGRGPRPEDPTMEELLAFCRNTLRLEPEACRRVAGCGPKDSRAKCKRKMLSQHRGGWPAYQAEVSGVAPPTNYWRIYKEAMADCDRWSSWNELECRKSLGCTAQMDEVDCGKRIEAERRPP